MRRRRLGFVLTVGLSLCAIVGLPPSSAAADPSSVTINLTAVVDLVDNYSGVPLGIAQGDVITGSYTYNPKTKDTNSLVEVGDYQHNKKKYGIQLNLGSFSTRTDPSNVNFLVEIVNDYNALDNYLLRSYNNTSTGPTVEHISWQLDDPTQTALSSAALPSSAPVLSSWQQPFGLTVQGPSDDPSNYWLIRAHVTQAVKVG